MSKPYTVDELSKLNAMYAGDEHEESTIRRLLANVHDLAEHNRSKAFYIAVDSPMMGSDKVYGMRLCLNPRQLLDGGGHGEQDQGSADGISGGRGSQGESVPS